MLCAVVSDSVAPWTVAHQAPLSTGILQARVLVWVAMPSSRDRPDPGIEPRFPAVQVDSLLTEPVVEGNISLLLVKKYFTNSLTLDSRQRKI